MKVTNGKVPRLWFETDQTAWSQLIRRTPGTTILFTDNDDWSMEEVVLGYRSQSEIEDAFRQLKDPHHLSWWQMYHWTDDKVRVHTFTSVLAILLSSLLQRTLCGKKIEMSILRISEVLGGIRETLAIYPNKAGERVPSIAHSLSTLNVEQQLLEALDLRRYLN